MYSPLSYFYSRKHFTNKTRYTLSGLNKPISEVLKIFHEMQRFKD